MKELSGWEKKYIRSLAHHLSPLIHVGKAGVTEPSIAAINKALEDHELIKIKFIGFKEEKEALSQKISEATDSVIAGIIGNILILFRQNPDTAKRKIKIPKKA